MQLKREFSTDAFERSRAPFAMCHASNVLPLKSGGTLTVFFAGSHEGAADTAIYACRADKEGQSALPVPVASGSEAHWNPVLFELKDGRIALIFKVGDVIASWRSFICESSDEGRNWSTPRELVKGDIGGRGPVRNKPIRLKSGRILCPASLEEGPWRCFIDRSDDELKTLAKSNEICCEVRGESQVQDSSIAVSAQSFAGRGIIQPTLWEDDSGVHALMRSTEGYVMRSDSADEGETFSEPYAVDMPNNNSGLDAVYTKGTLFLVCNPVKGNWGRRSPLTLFSSTDGRTFKEETVLASGEGEFSYPCIRAAGNALYVSYTNDRKNIAISKFLINTME